MIGKLLSDRILDRQFYTIYLKKKKRNGYYNNQDRYGCNICNQFFTARFSRIWDHVADHLSSGDVY